MLMHERHVKDMSYGGGIFECAFSVNCVQVKRDSRELVCENKCGVCVCVQCAKEIAEEIWSTSALNSYGAINQVDLN